MLQRSGKKNCSSSCYYSWLTYNCTDDRDLVLSHLIMLADDDFLKKHCDSETPAPPPNWVSASNQTSGMLAALVNNLKKKNLLSDLESFLHLHNCTFLSLSLENFRITLVLSSTSHTIVNIYIQQLKLLCRVQCRAPDV